MGRCEIHKGRSSNLRITLRAHEPAHIWEGRDSLPLYAFLQNRIFYSPANTLI